MARKKEEKKLHPVGAYMGNQSHRSGNVPHTPNIWRSSQSNLIEPTPFSRELSPLDIFVFPGDLSKLKLSVLVLA